MNTKLPSLTFLGACLSALILALNLSAQTTLTINCCYDAANGYGQQYGDSGVVISNSPSDLWNAMWGNSSLAGGELIDTSWNVVTNVGISLSGGSFVSETTADFDDSTFGLEVGYYTKQNGMITNSITGLTPFIGNPFTLVIYGAGNANGQGGVINIIAGATGGNSGLTLTNTGASRHISAGQGVAYNIFTGTISGGTLTITSTNTGASGYTAFNGIQLQIAGVPGATPFISSQPPPISVFTNNTAIFKVSTISTSAVSYQWAAGLTGSGGPYTNLVNGGQISGANGPMLTVADIASSNALDYVVIVTNISGAVTSSPATLTVESGNQNQLIDVQVGVGADQSGAAVLGQSGDSWNSLTYDGGEPYNSTVIKDSSGNGLSGVVVISDNWTGKESSSTSGTTYDSATAGLMENYLYNADNTYPYAPIYETIYGLAPYVGQNFQLVVYAAGNGAGQGSALNIVSGATGGNTASTLTTLGTTRQVSKGIGWAYNIFSGTLTNTTLIFSSYSGGATIYGAVNGFQLELFATNPPPVILQQPVSAAIAINNAFTNTVAAYGAGTLYYQWYTNVVVAGVTNGVPIGSAANITGQTASGVFTNSLIINPALTADSGSYFVVITNLNGAVTSSVVSLTVAAAPDILTQLPVTYSNVLNTNFMTLYAGANPTFSVSAIGATPLSYLWFTNGVAFGKATNASLTLTNVSVGANTVYCIVTNLVGSSTTAVWWASVIADPTNSSNGLAPYPQQVLALNPIGYWRLNDTNLDGVDNGVGDNGYVCHDYVGGNDGMYSNVVLGDVQGGTGYNPITDPSDTSALFGIDPNSANNNGDPGDEEADYIEGINFSTPAGSSAAFTVEAWVQGYAQAASGGIVSLGWGNGGEQFDLDCGAATNAFRFFMRDAAGNTHGVNSIVLPSTTANPGPWYHLAAVVDEINSQTVTFYINGQSVGSASVPSGSGVLSSTYPMVIGSRSSALGTNNNLQFEGWINDVSVFNYALSSNQIAGEYLNSGVAPYFTQQPVAATNVDQNAVLTVPEVAVGTSPLSYQWFDVGANNYIAGQTNASLVISNIQASDSYYATVSNLYGSTNSSRVLVSIISGLSLTVQGPQELFVGQTASYLATAQGNYPIYYQWLTNGVAVGNATNPTFSLVMPAGNSTVGCTVTNSYNGYSSSNVTLNLTGFAVPTGLYQLTILSNSPAAFWRLDETPDNGSGNLGTVAYDYVGGHNGAYTNVELGMAGFNPLANPAEPAADFGTNNNVYSGQPLTINANGAGFSAMVESATNNGVAALNFSAPVGSNAEFTAEALVSEVSDTEGGAVVGQGLGGSEVFYIDSGTSADAWRFFVRTANQTAYDANSSIVPQSNVWYYVAGVCDEAHGLLSLYVNGVLVATNNTLPIQGGLALYSGPVSIGDRLSSSGAFTGESTQVNGRISDVALYNYALSASQIAADYAATGLAVPPVSTNPTNIVAAVTNNMLYLTWPANHIGWQLQAQTNTVKAGIGNNWVNYNPSIGTNQVAIPINLNNGTVFYRLTY